MCGGVGDQLRGVAVDVSAAAGGGGASCYTTSSAGQM